ncbi:hypothetical protein [Celeribacter marinus]|uniref:Uncharacterized protein n=1 Tax=Celeribacter marinus TaxID=1397108 RepID=A0A0N9ZX87_9RHOB|nr:hypothetical protein [Celeribacter marinus]ALI54706.1 hypothetical protein IMCC12053_758 [Celeribacter marinus]SFK53996.1 hypothetical protein SAMN05444421_105126 [Celeribacter marinus]
MTNSIALGLAIVILVALGLDFGVNDGTASLFLARKMLGVLHYIAFWR